MSTPAGVRLVSVKLTPVGRPHTFVSTARNGDAAPQPGDQVVVQSEAGPAMGTVVRSVPQTVERRMPTFEPPRVIRVASHDDVVMRLKHEQRERDAHRIATLKIRERGLGMKLAKTEQTFDGTRLIFYFTAEGRVDFRGLRHLRASAVLHDVPHVVRARIDQDGETAGPESQPVEAVGPVRPIEVLPAVRASECQRRAARRLRQ